MSFLQFPPSTLTQHLLSAVAVSSGYSEGPSWKTWLDLHDARVDHGNPPVLWEKAYLEHHVSEELSLVVGA